MRNTLELHRTPVWSIDAGRLYAQGAAAQWDPATAIQWNTEFDLPFEVEEAVVQIMTYPSNVRGTVGGMRMTACLAVGWDLNV